MDIQIFLWLQGRFWMIVIMDYSGNNLFVCRMLQRSVANSWHVIPRSSASLLWPCLKHKTLIDVQFTREKKASHLQMLKYLHSYTADFCFWYNGYLLIFCCRCLWPDISLRKKHNEIKCVYVHISRMNYYLYNYI